MRLLPACFSFRSRLHRTLLASALAGLLCGILGALPAAAQASESTVRDVLIASGFPENLLAILPPALLDQPASVLNGNDTAGLAAFLAQLEAGGGNVDTSGADCQLALGAAYSGLWLSSILEPPPLVTADWAAFTTNLNLKRCAPVLRAPPDLGLEPDSPNACFRTVHNQRTQERASKIFFVDAASRDPNWGPLGTPITDHYNSGMATSIHSIRRGGAFAASYQNEWDPFYADDAPENPAARRDLQLSLGRNVVTWQAGALADLLDFIWLPLPGIPAGWKAPFAKNIKNEALRALFETGVDFAAQLTRDVGSDKFGDYLRDYPTDSVVTVEQTVDVYDRVPPTITTNQTAFSFEGTILGGASIRTAPYRAALENALAYADNCENDAELIPPPVELWPVDQTTPVTWTVLDAGPNPASPRADRRNAASVTQLVTVVDTLAPVIRPPEGVIRESAAPVAIALQAPQIFDFVDAAPAVANDAPATFPLGTTPVTWTVTDQSGNTANAVQYVAVKAPGTNTAPTAQPLAASAESFTTTPILVTGQDADLDSLLFRIEDQPENGFFVAPLFPYFVGDLRQQGLQGLPNNGCGRDPSTIYQPEYVAIDDDERSYVLNAPVNCIQFTPQSRITVLDRDGNFVVGRDLPKSQNLYGLWIDPDERFIAYTHFELIGPFETYNVVSKIDLDTLETLVEIRLPLNQGSQKSVFDGEGFLYSTTSAPNGEVVVYDLRDRAPVDGRIELDANDEIAAYTLTPEGSVVPASDIAIDSQRNLYVSSFQRIFKFSPVERTDDEQIAAVPGELIGWMGGCKGGSACDLARGISRGYTCTDATCTPLVGGLDPSGAPGQFLGLAGIALDPNDNLYCADSVNARVQRFTPEGYFAGQARTTCSDNESCFVRSEFSVPRAVSVNSKRFHVLDTTLDVLYMFDTSVVEPLRNPTTNLVDSARLLYQSNSGFTGTDHFRFVAGDGLAESAPAEVTVSVSRGFHPPEARDSHVSFLRWERKDVELVGLDPDFPFDTLTYTIESPPLHGWLSGDGATRTYWADADFVGVDSFTFRVSDGVTESEPARVTIEVIDSNVPAQPVSPGAVLHAGLGYPLLLSVPFADRNREGTYGGLVEWGDGIVEDSDTGGIEVIGGGNSGVVSGAHTYASNGTFRLAACVEDGSYPSDVPIFTACGFPRTDVVVEPMTDLRVGILDDNGPAPVGGALHYAIRVDHMAPDPTITPGLPAQGVAAKIVLAPNLGFAELPAGLGCTTGIRLVDGVDVATCALPLLSPGASVEFPIVLRARAATVDQAAWTVEIVSATPDPQAPNIALALPRVIAGASDERHAVARRNRGGRGAGHARAREPGDQPLLDRRRDRRGAGGATRGRDPAGRHPVGNRCHRPGERLASGDQRADRVVHVGRRRPLRRPARRLRGRAHLDRSRLAGQLRNRPGFGKHGDGTARAVLDPARDPRHDERFACAAVDRGYGDRVVVPRSFARRGTLRGGRRRDGRRTHAARGNAHGRADRRSGVFRARTRRRGRGVPKPVLAVRVGRRDPERRVDHRIDRSAALLTRARLRRGTRRDLQRHGHTRGGPRHRNDRTRRATRDRSPQGCRTARACSGICRAAHAVHPRAGRRPGRCGGAARTGVAQPAGSAARRSQPPSANASASASTIAGGHNTRTSPRLKWGRQARTLSTSRRASSGRPIPTRQTAARGRMLKPSPLSCSTLRRVHVSASSKRSAHTSAIAR